ncbi:MAG: helicase C-terminal domain-containing protein, partial [Candidatus Omnitrophica bacterium]|nr:helicase C-terminal domain-containing protein [Candidatus Omnitrophota bacterium]
ARELLKENGLSDDRAISAYFDARLADGNSYGVKDGDIKPVEGGNLQESRVFSDPYFIAALYAKEKTKPNSEVIRDKLVYSETSSQATVAEVLGMFGKDASVLGASGTLQTVELMHSLHLGKGIAKVSESKYDVTLTENMTVKEMEAAVSQAVRNKGNRGLLIFVKDPEIFAQLKEALEKLGLGEVVTIDSLKTEIEVGNIANNAHGKIILSNVKGATGIDYKGLNDLIVADAHNWSISELDQAIGRNRRSAETQDGKRYVYYQKDALREQVLKSGERKDIFANKSFASEDSAPVEAKELIRNAEILQIEEISDALVHHISEAAYSRGVTEPFKALIRIASPEERQKLEDILNIVLNKKSSEVNLALALHPNDPEALIREGILRAAEISAEKFNEIAKDPKFSKAITSRAEVLSEIAEDVVKRYDQLQGRRDISLREAANLRELAEVAKHSRYIERILPEEIRHGRDITKDTQVAEIMKTVETERQKAGDPELTLTEKADIYKNLDRVIFSNGNRGSPEAVNAIIKYMPNNSALRSALQNIAQSQSAPSAITTPQAAQTIVSLIDGHINRAYSFKHSSEQEKLEAAQFVVSAINPKLSYENAVVAAIAYGLLKSKAKQEVNNDAKLAQAFLAKPEMFIQALAQPAWYVEPFIWWQKRQVNKNTFLISAPQQFVFDKANRLALSSRQMNKGLQMNFRELYHHASGLIYKVTGNPVANFEQVERLEFALLRLHNANLGWTEFKAAKARSGQLEAMHIGNPKLKGRALFSRKVENRLQEIDMEITRLMLEQFKIYASAPEKAQELSKVIERLRKEKTKIEKESLWTSRQLLINKIYIYYIKGEDAFSADALIKAGRQTLGILRLVQKSGKLDEEYKKIIDAMLSKESEGVTLSDLGENETVRQNIISLIAPFTTVSTRTIQQRDEQLQRFTAFLGEEEVKEYRNLTKLLVSEYQFKQNLKALEESTHQKALDKATGKDNELVDPFTMDKQAEQRQRILAFVLQGILSQGLINQKQYSVFMKYGLTNRVEGATFAEHADYIKVSNILKDQVAALFAPLRAIDAQACLTRLANQDDPAALEDLSSLARMILRSNGLSFNQGVFASKINALKQAKQDADVNLNKLLAETTDPYLVKYIRAALNSTSGYFMNRILNNPYSYDERPYQERMQKLEAWTKTTVDSMRQELEHSPEMTIIITTGATQTSEKVFPDIKDWLEWRIAGLERALVNVDSLTKEQRDWYRAELRFYQDKLAGGLNSGELVQQSETLRNAQVRISEFESDMAKLIDNDFTKLTQEHRDELKNRMLNALKTGDAGKYDKAIRRMLAQRKQPANKKTRLVNPVEYVKLLTDVETITERIKYLKTGIDEVLKAVADSEKEPLINEAAKLNFLKRAFDVDQSDIYNLEGRLAILERFAMLPQDDVVRQKLAEMSTRDFLKKALDFAQKFWKGELKINEVDFAHFIGDKEIPKAADKDADKAATDTKAKPRLTLHKSLWIVP